MAENSKIKQIKIGSTTYDIEPQSSAVFTVTNNAPAPAFGATATIGNVGGTNLTLTIPGTNSSEASGGTGLSLVTTGEKYTWNHKSNLALVASGGNNGSASTAARSDHTHALTLASDTGTSAITLGYGGKYKITAGGNSVIFTMPSADDTNTSHSHSAGVGLTGSGSAGIGGGTYTYKVNLVNETVASNAASYTAGGDSKFYAVQLDKNNKLGVYVPWTDNNTTSFTITANATDGIFDLTGTNGTNAVTYALAPYASGTANSTWVGTAGNAGKFYLGTVAPSKDTRLNYNGYFYGTKLYSGGKEVLVSDNIGDQVTYSLSGSTLTITSK